MHLLEALALPDRTVLSSLTVFVKDYFTTYNAKKGYITVYNVSGGGQEAKLKIMAPVQVQLLANTTYIFQSTIDYKGLRGLEVNRWKGTSSILCTEGALYEPLTPSTIQINNIPMTPNTTPPAGTQAQETPLPAAPRNYETQPMSQAELIAYYGNVYIRFKKQLMGADIVEDQAHEAAMKMMEMIPQSWFGQKRHPA